MINVSVKDVIQICEQLSHVSYEREQLMDVAVNKI